MASTSRMLGAPRTVHSWPSDAAGLQRRGSCWVCLLPPAQRKGTSRTAPDVDVAA
jgi:hypothetical protein